MRHTTVTTRRGKFDWLHPHDVQYAVRFEVPWMEKAVSETIPEDRFEQYFGDCNSPLEYAQECLRYASECFAHSGRGELQALVATLEGRLLEDERGRLYAEVDAAGKRISKAMGERDKALRELQFAQGTDTIVVKCEAHGARLWDEPYCPVCGDEAEVVEQS